MERDDAIQEARKILKEIEDIPISRLTVKEALFLFRNCIRKGGHAPNVIDTFDQEDLLELYEIVLAINQRGGPKAIH